MNNNNLNMNMNMNNIIHTTISGTSKPASNYESETENLGSKKYI